MNAHKFKSDKVDHDGYSLVVYCEYCGTVAFYANWSSKYENYQEKANKPCPLAPAPQKGE